MHMYHLVSVFRPKLKWCREYSCISSPNFNADEREHIRPYTSDWMEVIPWSRLSLSCRPGHEERHGR